MSYLRVMILVPIDKEKVLEEELKQVELSCMHFLKVRGYGCNPNFYASDWSDEVAKFELVIKEDQLELVKNSIKKACQTGSEDDGMIGVTPLTEMVSIKDL
ncbi:P-II family nitrogen regulator [Alkalimarinus coralli]|uniref:P-II family nitrogen regulator n=1 Tax=Alkalimarinus coralli TaxID=2935863 RepID=UPI00202B4EE0|nr:P-II family nitrogen regulator [Alkalimarinus coralli]